MKERWTPIFGWENLYEVSSRGRVRNSRTKRIKAQHTHGNAYLQTWLCCPKRAAVCCLVQRLVLLSFRGLPPTEKHEARHLDGNPANNRLSNLRWATHRRNEQDKVRHGTLLHGEKHQWSKLTAANVRHCRKMRAKGVALQALGAKYGVHLSTISAACCGVSWNHV